MKSILLKSFKYNIAECVKQDLITDSNTYITIGRPLPWGNDVTETSDEISDVIESTLDKFSVQRSAVAMVKLQPTDIQFVIPRIDWETGTVYDEYSDTIDVFSHISKELLGTVDANTDIVLGAANITSGSNTVTGNSTTFIGNVYIGDTISINSETKTITAVNSNTSLTVNSTFTYGGTDNAVSLLANSYVIKKNTADFSTLSQGDFIQISDETKEIIFVKNNTTVVVNSEFQSAYSNTDMLSVIDQYPQFANNFYVRNSSDQVFKCLFNNSGATSNVEPTIGLDGNLPESPSIETSDGYKWKYLYTIPYGYKQKFFNRNWMPVVTDSSAESASVDGRIDLVRVLSGGTDYYSGGTANSLSIVSVKGDGTGANVTARVESGVITGINILRGGSGYTYATIAVDDPLQSGSGEEATFKVDIAPKYGHGSNPVKELGCFTMMISSELEGDVGGVVPVDDFDYRQISLVKNPLLANGDFASNSQYRLTTKVTGSFSGTIENDDHLYVLENALGIEDFFCVAVSVETDSSQLYINNITGNLPNTLETTKTLVSSNSLGEIFITSIEEPDVDIHSGDLMYYENRQKITRNQDQTEQIRIVLSF